ncbi:hypothetical protein BT69DRAFT_1291252 [Atractiella rhizophila]|nr:hypothetical protein BT69DRAFT_1291252 [Atractiella rhizophila]
MPLSQQSPGPTEEEHVDPGAKNLTNAFSTSSTSAYSTDTASFNGLPPSLKAEDTTRKTLLFLGLDGEAMSRQEFLSYHSPTSQSLWHISFRDGSERSVTYDASRIYDDYTYPLARFELNILYTNFKNSDLHVRSSFQVICEDPSEDVVARGEISDLFQLDRLNHAAEEKVYLVHRSLTFTSVRRPELLERRHRIQQDNGGKIPNASARYDAYLRLTQLARRLREVRKVFNPALAFSALAVSVAANPTFSIEVRSGFAVSATVTAFASCLLFISGIFVEILEKKMRRLILDIAPSDWSSRNLNRSNFFRRISSLKRYSAFFVASAAVAASVASHPNIPQRSKVAFALAGFVLAATGWALYIVSWTTTLFVDEGIAVVAEEAKDESSMPVKGKDLGIM